MFELIVMELCKYIMPTKPILTATGNTNITEFNISETKPYYNIT
jgi:hypothetical protein